MFLAALSQTPESPICKENNMSGNERYVFLPQEQKFMQYIPESATIGHDIHATEQTLTYSMIFPSQWQTVLLGHKYNII